MTHFFHELGYAIVNNELTVQECFNFINIISSHNNIDELYENTVKIYELIKPIKKSLNKQKILLTL